MALKSESRSWRDLDGNRSALDAFGNAQYDEIGPARNVNFGLDTGTTRLDAGLPRGFNWEESIVVQREITPGFSVSGGYYWRQYHNLTWTDNLLVDPDADYTPFTFVGPVDPRLPNGGGEVITMYNLNPNKLGLVDNVVKINDTRTLGLRRAGVYGGRTAQERRVLPGRVHDRTQQHVQLRRRQPELAPLLRRRAAVPPDVEGLGILAAAVRHGSERRVAHSAGRQHRRRLTR